MTWKERLKEFYSVVEYFFVLAGMVAIGCIPVYAFRQGDIGVFYFALNVIGVILLTLFVFVLALLILSWILRSARCISLIQQFVAWCQEKEIAKRIVDTETQLFLMVWRVLVVWVNIYEKIVDIAWKIIKKIPFLAYMVTVAFFALGPLSIYRTFGLAGLWLCLVITGSAIFSLFLVLAKKYFVKISSEIDEEI